MGADMGMKLLPKPALIIAATVGLVGGALGTFAPAAAAGRISNVKQPSAIEVISRVVPITSSTHKTLGLKIGGADFVSLGDPSNSPASINATVSTPNGHESHSWTFQLVPGSFTTNSATTKGTLDTGVSQIMPFGQIAMTFAPVGSKVTTLKCDASTSLVTRRIKINATMSLDTQSSWGKVGSLSHVVHFGTHGVLSRQFGGGDCPPPPKYDSCATNVDWFANQGDVSISGGWTKVHGKKRGRIVGSRLSFLTTPAEAVRTDTVVAKAPAPKLKVAHGKPNLLVKTSGGGATGSARLKSSTAAAPQTVRCNSKHHHETLQSWSTASFSNRSPQLALHEKIEGLLVLPNLTNTAQVSRSTQIN
jgi:hypothetical protein